MTNSIQSINLNKLIDHPDNPNRMSSSDFKKLVRNIERTGKYEPLVVRPHPQKPDAFEIINGHHRRRALAELDCREAEAVVWDVDDEQTGIFLATLNRLGGADRLDKKLKLLKQLSKKIKFAELAKILPQTAKQIDRLVNLKRPAIPVKVNTKTPASPLVFFLDDKQRQIVEQAMLLAPQSAKTKAAQRAVSIVHISEYFVRNSKTN